MTMNLLVFLTHPEVVIDPQVPVPQWRLSDRGIARMRMFTEATGIRWQAIFCSDERKARDGAQIVAGSAGLEPVVARDLAENDRSATGYLDKVAFEAHADRFFAHPRESIGGWERAVDAQTRIVGAVMRIDREAPASGNILVVAHGGVGALLLAHLSDRPISRALDQPGGGGGNLLTLRRNPLALVHGWRAIEDLIA
ncbi:MAG: histidine phosphatase family protein [Geminicoccaceae bacterium]|nr:histidine phosphatase family protein [Geminicoccaceae bacterium]